MATKKPQSRSKKKTTTKRTKKRKTPITSKPKKPKAKGENARDDQRIPIQLLVDYSCDGHYLFDFCKDLGTGGVFIQTNSPLPQGSSVDLTFTIPDSKETLQTKGQVIWVQEEVSSRRDLVPGMGVQFSKFGIEQRQILENFVSRYHGTKYTQPNISGKKTA